MRPLGFLCVCLLGFSSICAAQESNPEAKSEGIVGVGRQFVQDEAHLWSSPARVKRDDLRWLLPLGIGTAALINSDRHISSEIGEVRNIQTPSHTVSKDGAAAVYALPVAMIAVGRLTKDDRAAHAGSLAMQAVLHSAIVVQTLKAATNRERPDKTSGQGGFWDGGKSFPSGHAISSWAFAAAISSQYRDKKFVRIGAYAMATAISLSRISGQNHFPSDVLVGSTMGYLIGHYIGTHHQ